MRSRSKLVRSTWVAAVFGLFILSAEVCLSASVIKSNAKTALIEFDPINENFANGDKLSLSLDGQNKALLQVAKIKGNRLVARILNGIAKPGMEIKKVDVVTQQETPPPVDTAPTATAVAPSVTISIGSVNVWRGQPSITSLQETRPAIQGTLDYANSGLLAGLYIGNSFPPAKSETDLYLGYEFSVSNITSSLMVNRAFFSEAPQLDTWDYSLTVGFPIFSVLVNYMPDYYGTNSNCVYYKVSASIGVGQNWKIKTQVGQSNFSDEVKIGHKSYSDYKIGLLYAVSEFNVEFNWTDTDRKDLAGTKIKDSTSAVVISKTF